MVLDLKVPHEANPAALAELWPTFLSYALSYLFVGTFWVNHHHLLHHTERAEPGVIWANLLVLFFVSLIPFFTAYMAESRMEPFTTAVYAGIFWLITIAFMILQNTIARQFGSNSELRAMDRAGHQTELDCVGRLCRGDSGRLSSPVGSAGDCFRRRGALFRPRRPPALNEIQRDSGFHFHWNAIQERGFVAPASYRVGGRLLRGFRSRQWADVSYGAVLRDKDFEQHHPG